MASSGKKGKKNKGTVISLQSFLSNGDTPVGTTQVSKKIRNVDGDDSDDGNNSLPVVYQLPTAPRANRIFDDDSIPHKPPFIAYVTNLPFDVSEEDIYSFFGNIPITSLNLPREGGETGRVRGFGYVELENRDDLIEVLSLPDPVIKGRRIRIELSNENEQQNNRQRGSRRGFDNFGNNGENRESTNWRRDNANQDGGNFGNGYERDRGFNRDRDRDRERKFGSDDNSTPGSWRTGNRPNPSDLSPRGERGDRDRGDRDRGDRDRGDRDRGDRDRGDRGDRERHRDNMSRNRNNDREDRIRTQNNEEAIQERPKLNLKPRTLPLPEIVTKPDELESDKETSEPTKVVKPSGATSEKVFGSAKPVDTAARELEIEKRLSEERRQEKLKREQEEVDVNVQLEDIHLEKTNKDNTNSAISWRRRNDSDSKNGGKNYSPERRQDDRRRDNRDRDYNRYKNRDRSERSDTQRVRQNQQNQQNQPRDGKKEKDDNKLKRDTKIERPLPKYQPNQTGPVLQSSNKYDGLDDEASDD